MCAGNKQPTNQDNVYERSKPIASDRKLTKKGGVHDLLFNAVLTDDSMFHNDTSTVYSFFRKRHSEKEKLLKKGRS